MRLWMTLLLLGPAFAHADVNPRLLSWESAWVEESAPVSLMAESEDIAEDSEPALNETERFTQVYDEIEQSFRARGTSPQLLNSLMQALKNPIREATRGPASESNVIDVRGIDEVMRRYIENQDEDAEE